MGDCAFNSYEEEGSLVALSLYNLFMAPALVTVSILCLMVSARGDAAVQVNGLLHQSVQLRIAQHLRFNVQDVVWQFITEGKTMKVAKFEDNQLKISYPQFTDRLEVSNNGTILRIKDLRTEDTGGYTAHITLIDHITRLNQFFLTVYEPVPTLDIRIELERKNTDWCNMSLHCSVLPNTSMLSYTWKDRLEDSEYPLYKNGNTIQMSLQPESWSMEVLCIVHNPVDQKNLSINVREACAVIDQPRHYLTLIIIIGVLLVLVLAFAIWKRRRKRHAHIVEEIDYCTPEFYNNPPPNGVSQILCNEERADLPNPPPQKFETIYTCLEMKN